MSHPTALIAEDEPLLAASLRTELACQWPQLQVLATVGDGASAVTQALALRPDVLFFDIRMPGQSGMDAAAELAERWDTAAKPFPALVFVTAYDQYAVAAFEAQALDYLLKPVQAQRLQKTIEKVCLALAGRVQGAINFEATLAQLRGLLAPPMPAATARLTLIQASVGNQIHLVPVDEVLYFEAADKYVRVLTAHQEYLIRTPLRELLVQLDPAVFWQVHRGTLVRTTAIARVLRDEDGKLSLALHGRSERLTVSRLYTALFKAM